MLHVRVVVPADLTEDVLDVFRGDPAVSALTLHRGAALDPEGDVVTADVAREAGNEVVDRLDAIGVPERGSVHLHQVPTWVSRRGYDAERVTPGASADAVVWADVTQRAYEETELNWTYLSFMVMATSLVTIAIVLDSQVLLIGAMVLGPEFVAVAALGLALVRRRMTLFRHALRSLSVGFAVAIAATTALCLLARLAGWVEVGDVTGDRSGTSFIYTPDRWSFLVALIAAAAGVLSLTSAKVGGLSGVFISVTTIPAAGNIALGLAFGVQEAVVGSALNLALNVTGMVLAGWATLALQQRIWQRMAHHRARLVGRHRG